MTDEQQKLAKFESWERYRSDRANLAALTSKIEGWRFTFKRLSETEKFNENDFDGIPSQEDFKSTIRELHAAEVSLRKSANLARDNGFTVDPQ